MTCGCDTEWGSSDAIHPKLEHDVSRLWSLYRPSQLVKVSFYMAYKVARTKLGWHPYMHNNCSDASDATYQFMWVIVFNAVDDFGRKEFNDAVRMSLLPNMLPNPTIESVKQTMLGSYRMVPYKSLIW
ncbi:hypothetical protein ACEPAG_2046 [Sanghuangporus baumii]